MVTLQRPPRTAAVRGGAPRVPKRKRSADGPMERQRRRMFWPFTAPALIVYATLFLAPVAFAFYTSLYRWDGMSAMQWRGLTNYQMLFLDPDFRSSLVNTLELMVVGGVITFVISFALTLVLREMRARLFARSVLFFPSLVNGMVFGIAAGFLFSPSGPVNHALEFLGVTTPPKWLSTDNLLPMILGTLVWTATGYYTSIIMAAVDQIPPYLYEAAELDGANAFQRFRHITLPCAWDVISVCAVLWTVSSVKIFELILLFGGSTNAYPPVSSWNTALYVYAEAFPQASVPRLGMATAAAVVSLLMVTVVTLVLRRLLRREPIEY
ncbi:carbohydrate ABC transporter permease [Streptacidiphilus fuscans]|uniref:Sugar ABC transporter permease n=1 Tax=Streptacidiphilus fuscans TaxID=2789292 RepID=A0A931FG11_9ACTN|nr:sugar ABC transporter permease [Streptacidiphilus fuscans]MBF9068989.1 sugar ABC transporter permease [Streptacidiphilus fuscans]MBF9073443.1 sugar ABC transporter permease [Streptacidiphilus fuscans]